MRRPHLAARRRLDHDRPERVAVVGRRRQALVEERRGREVELDVGRRQAAPRLEEAARLRVVRGERPAALALEQREVLGREDPEEARLVGQVVDVDHAVVLRGSRPTGRSWRTAIPKSLEAPRAGPMPESISSTGDW